MPVTGHSSDGFLARRMQLISKRQMLEPFEGFPVLQSWFLPCKVSWWGVVGEISETNRGFMETAPAVFESASHLLFVYNRFQQVI